MKYTLLKLVQKVLSSTSSDEVNSISDTVESMQVVDIIEDVFMNMVENSVIPELEDLIQLEALADSDHPNYLKIPDGTDQINEIYYNVSETTPLGVDYKELKYVTKSDFLKMQARLTDEAENSEVITHFNGTKFVIFNNRHPTYWTTFDDKYIVTDAYKQTVDTTLQQQKTMTISRKAPEFVREDEFVLPIDDNLFPRLLNEAKSWAYLELKQTTHVKAEQQSRKQRIKEQKHRDRITKENCRNDYGRR